ncbi:TPA: hypothetical protein ACL2UI_001513 [Streptococcus pneumoniae]
MKKMMTFLKKAKVKAFTLVEDKIIELADYFISENTTYREAKIACEKLLKQVSHEIELRALESETKV